MNDFCFVLFCFHLSDSHLFAAAARVDSSQG
jgi:hypothetical protein